MKKLLTLAALALAAAAAHAQSYDEIVRLRSMNETVRGIRSMADGVHYTVLEDNTIRKYAYAEACAGETLLPETPDSFAIADYQLSPDERTILVASGSEPIYRHSYTTRYYLSDARGLRPIMLGIDSTRDASFSPDGRRIAFSSRNEIGRASCRERV